MRSSLRNKKHVHTVTNPFPSSPSLCRGIVFRATNSSPTNINVRFFFHDIDPCWVKKSKKRAEMRGSDVWPTCAQSVTTNNGVKMTKFTIIFSYLGGGELSLYTRIVATTETFMNLRRVYSCASCGSKSESATRHMTTHSVFISSVCVC
jgi:hypothetical protein